MSHGKYLRRPGLWPAGTVPETSDYRRLDDAQARAINGDEGGSWDPANALALGGMGVNLTSGGSEIVGGVRTQLGGRFVLGANDYVQLSPSQSRTLSMPLLLAGMQSGTGYRSTDKTFTIALPPGPTGIVAVSHSIPVQIEIPKRYLHKGARFTGAKLNFHTKPVAAQGVSFTFNANNLDDSVAQTFSAVSAATWLASHAFTIGQYVQPTATKATGLYYKRTLGVGTTGASEPTWPTVIGGTVVDNTATWTCIGFVGAMSAATISYLTSYANEDQSLALDQDPAVSLIVDPASYIYLVTITADPQTVLHSLEMTYSSISTNAPP